MRVLFVFCDVFVLQSGARTFYVHYWEFKPAVAEWKEAHARNDQAAMNAAFAKEQIAHDRTFDPFWFIK